MATTDAKTTIEGEKDLEKEEYLKLYEIAVTEDHVTMNLYQARVSFYFGSLMAIITAFVGLCALLLSNSDFQYAHKGLIVATISLSILLIVIGRVATKVTSSEYRSWCEKIACKAKIEQRLGITEPPIPASDKGGLFWWESESLVMQRHLDSRASAISSADFVNKMKDGGMHKHNIRLFEWATYLGIVLLGATAIWIIARIVCAFCRG